MIDKFKLRHLDLLLEDKIDYAVLMVEVNGYRNTWWNKRWVFLRSFKETFQLIEYLKGLDPKAIELNRDCNIKVPDTIEEISFSAMMELHSLANSDNELTVSQLMAETIAIACFSANSEEKFDIDTSTFKSFKSTVEESSAISMIGISNWIDQSLKQSTLYWEQKFMEVQVIDKDYEQAGGERMNAFNIVNTVKSICQDFNLTYEQAWQVPYVLTQINSLSRATSGFIQHQMSIIKEARMKASRKNK